MLTSVSICVDVHSMYSIRAVNNVYIYCYYNVIERRDSSVCCLVNLPPIKSDDTVATANPTPAGSNGSRQVVGWETNERGKPGPRLADLSSSM